MKQEIHLIFETARLLGWLRSLTRKILRLSALFAVSAVLAHILSQASLMMAFFLPLKALILLAMEGIPWYLEGFVTQSEKEFFIFVLAASAMACYVMHLVFEAAFSSAARRGSDAIQRRSDKLSMFANQEDVAREAYMKFSRSVASCFLVALAFGLGAYLEPFLFAAVGLLILLQYLLIASALRSQLRFSRLATSLLVERQAQALNILSALTFLAGFALLFASFVASEDRNVMIAIASFLLLRQATTRLSVAIQDLLFLSRSRRRIDALYYTSIPYEHEVPLMTKDILLQECAPKHRHNWMQRGLSEILGQTVYISSSSWLDSGVVGLAVFEVECSEYDADQTDSHQHILLKCFTQSQRKLVQHEADLLSSLGDFRGIAPEFIGQSVVGTIGIVAYSGLPKAHPPAREWKRIAIDLHRKIWSLPVPDELKRRYMRTHQALPRRMETIMLSDLEPATDSNSALPLSVLREQWGGLLLALSSIPAVLRNPDVRPDFCRMAEDGTPVLWSWINWQIDLPGALEFATMPDDDNVAERVISRLYVLELAVKRQRLRQAMDAVLLLTPITPNIINDAAASCRDV